MVKSANRQARLKENEMVLERSRNETTKRSLIRLWRNLTRTTFQTNLISAVAAYQSAKRGRSTVVLSCQSTAGDAWRVRQHADYAECGWAAVTRRSGWCKRRREKMPWCEKDALNILLLVATLLLSVRIAYDYGPELGLNWGDSPESGRSTAGSHHSGLGHVSYTPASPPS